MINEKNCYHKERDRRIIHFFRKNYPFGKKSGRVNYSVRMNKEICENCNKELNRWKPLK